MGDVDYNYSLEKKPVKVPSEYEGNTCKHNPFEVEISSWDWRQ